MNIEFQRITGGPPLVDKRLNLNVYEVGPDGDQTWIASAVISREEMLDFLYDK